MAISSLSSKVLNQYATSTGLGASGGNGNNDRASLGKELLAAVSKATGNASLQDQVTLGISQSAAASGALTYDAKGLISQMRNQMLANNPMWQAEDGSNNNNSSGGGLFGQLGGGTSASGNALTGSAAHPLDPVINNADLAQAVKKNPSAASQYVNSQSRQGLINIFAK